MSEETTEKKSREPSIETLAKMLRKRVNEVNELTKKLADKGIDLEVSLDQDDNEIILGEIRLIKRL